MTFWQDLDAVGMVLWGLILADIILMLVLTSFYGKPAQPKDSQKPSLLDHIREVLGDL
jgi:O-antigen/teichoic acid export membrane protein